MRPELAVAWSADVGRAWTLLRSSFAASAPTSPSAGNATAGRSRPTAPGWPTAPPPPPPGLSGVPAYRFLHELETRTVALERQMALDDPLVMAGLRTQRRRAERHRVQGGPRAHAGLPDRTGTAAPPPVDLGVRADFDRPLGTSLWLAADPRVMATVAAVDPGIVELIVQKGAVQRSALQRLPADRRRAVVFSPFGAEDVFPSQLPEELPWQFGPLASDE